MSMINRPTSITIIGWWLLLSGLYGVFVSATMEMNPIAMQMAARSAVPLGVQEIYGVMNGFVIAACGIGFLKGMWWSRLVYLVWALLRLLLGFFIAPLWVVLLGGIIYFLVLSALCRRSVNLWFETSPY